MALFDTSLLHQFSKFNNFLCTCWFVGKSFSNFVPPAWKLDNPYYHKPQWQKKFLPSFFFEERYCFKARQNDFNLWKSNLASFIYIFRSLLSRTLCRSFIFRRYIFLSSWSKYSTCQVYQFLFQFFLRIWHWQKIKQKNVCSEN